MLVAKGCSRTLFTMAKLGDFVPANHLPCPDSLFCKCSLIR